MFPEWFGQRSTHAFRLTGTAIIWASHPTTENANQKVVDGLVRALDASNLKRVLWTSEDNAGRDRLGKLSKFSPPTVADGRVFVATFSGHVVVYGLLSP